MEDYFERDYSFVKKASSWEDGLGNLLIERGALKAYGDVLRKTPKIVVQKDKEAFENLRERCDLLAREEYGKVAAKVDYYYYQAWISVELSCFEFIMDDKKKLLIDALEKTHSVTFDIKNGKIRMRFLIYYFDDVAGQDDIDEAWIALLEKFNKEELKRFFDIDLDNMDFSASQQDDEEPNGRLSAKYEEGSNHDGKI